MYTDPIWPDIVILSNIALATIAFVVTLFYAI